MKNQILYALPFLGAVTARPAAMLRTREVPQEQSHRNVLLAVNEQLQLNNPDEIQDPVFGLLGAAAAIEGAGNIADTDCLQQATADQAFTNAKEAGDVDGMTFALIYRALERNSGQVGLATAACESIQAVNPEIAALQQHQDPAGDGAQDLNKQIAAVLAQQIASIGGDPALANEASTFEPGELDDATAAGNTCDDENDDLGCINSLGLRVDDLSDAEILAAVDDAGAAGVAAGNATAAAGAGKGNDSAEADDAAANDEASANDAEASANDAEASANDAEASANDAEASNNGAQASAFGSCADPSIVFGPPSDGRKEDAFEPADLADFNHGSALNIGVISGFICSQLTNACDAGADAVSTCEAAASAADGLSGQAAADAFNSALGI